MENARRGGPHAGAWANKAIQEASSLIRTLDGEREIADKVRGLLGKKLIGEIHDMAERYAPHRELPKYPEYL